MIDAGHAMMMDAGRTMVDAGMTIRDGGRSMMDASDGMVSDASAQPSCATECTTGGVLRAVTADSDLAQLATGAGDISLALSPIAFVDGPFVLTDVRALATSSGWGPITLRIVSTADGCSASTTTYVARVYPDGFHSSASTSQPLEGARIPIAAGETLCATANSNLNYRWAGFRPYE